MSSMCHCGSEGLTKRLGRLRLRTHTQTLHSQPGLGASFSLILVAPFPSEGFVLGLMAHSLSTAVSVLIANVTPEW
jgi:hypothetical protein